MLTLSFVMGCGAPEALIGPSIGSILAIDDSFDVEIVLIEEPGVVEAWAVARSFANRSSRVRLLGNSQGIAGVASWDIGIAEARGGYLCLLKPGECVAAVHIPELLSLLHAQPDLVVASRLEYDHRGFRSRSSYDILFPGVRTLTSAFEYPACIEDTCCTGKFIRADFLKSLGLRFGTRGDSVESTVFCAQLWLHAREIRFFHKPLHVRELGLSRFQESDCDDAIAGVCVLAELSRTQCNRAARGMLANGYARSLLDVVQRSTRLLGPVAVGEILKRRFLAVDLPESDCGDSIRRFIERCKMGDYAGAIQSACAGGEMEVANRGLARSG